MIPRFVIPDGVVAPPREVHARSLARPFAAAALASLLVLVVLRLAVRAVLPTWAVAILAPLAALLLVAAVFTSGVAMGPLATDERGEVRPLARRHGFWLVALGIVTGLPMLGASSLVDPWETHYAEVAREMLERRDFVSPWWANEGWFMTKPVLVLWLEALSMLVLGVRTGPDRSLPARLGGRGASRMGSALAGVRARDRRRLHPLQRRVADLRPSCRVRRRRRPPHDAGLCAALAPGDHRHAARGVGRRVARLPAARAETPATRPRSRAGRCASARAPSRCMRDTRWRSCCSRARCLSSRSSRPAMCTSTRSGLHLGADRLLAGSPHACTLPGQPACANVALAHPRLPPLLQVAFWAPLVLWLAGRLASETRAARLFAIAAWTAAAIGAMAKGPAALVIPAAAALVALGARRSLRPLLRLEILTGLAVVLVLVAPWYLAVYARHGRVFIDELVMKHMLGRTLDHLHDTNGADDVGIAYFVRQLGYATFPWSGIALVATLAAPSHDDGSRRGRATGAPLRSNAVRLRARLVDGHEVPPLWARRASGSRDARGHVARRARQRGVLAPGGDAHAVRRARSPSPALRSSCSSWRATSRSLRRTATLRRGRHGSSTS